MPQVEVGNFARKKVCIGQAGAVVRGGKPGNRKSRVHRVAYGLRREIGRAGVTAPLPDVDSHADALVAVVLYRLHFSATHRHRLAEALAYLGFGSACAPLYGMIQDVLCNLAKLFVGMGEMRVGHRCPFTSGTL